MTDKPTAHQVVRAAIYAAGGVMKVAEALGLSSPTVSRWVEKGSVPVHWVKPLCDLGANVVKQEQILEAVARSAADKAAA